MATAAPHLSEQLLSRISFGIQDADPQVQKAVNRMVAVFDLDQNQRTRGAWLI